MLAGIFYWMEGDPANPFTLFHIGIFYGKEAGKIHIPASLPDFSRQSEKSRIPRVRHPGPAGPYRPELASPVEKLFNIACAAAVPSPYSSCPLS
ncbi:MAG: hypothetical protein JKY68_05345 [Rhodospirillales bacterium]|nr:hypothetical protein [Rhodospirillales bacterium]